MCVSASVSVFKIFFDSPLTLFFFLSRFRYLVFFSTHVHSHGNLNLSAYLLFISIDSTVCAECVWIAATGCSMSWHYTIVAVTIGNVVICLWFSDNSTISKVHNCAYTIFATHHIKIIKLLSMCFFSLCFSFVCFGCFFVPVDNIARRRICVSRNSIYQYNFCATTLICINQNDKIIMLVRLIDSAVQPLRCAYVEPL